MSINFDLVVHRGNEDSFGYMCEWGEEGSAPISISSDPPDVPVSTSSGVVTSGGPFSGRDAAPPYPIEVCNWQDGAGQESYDNLDSSAEAYRESRSIDVTQAGHFEIGPRVLHFPNTAIENKIYPALGTFWAGFHPTGSGNQNSVRYLVRYRVAMATGTIADDATDLPLNDWSSVTDLSTGVTVVPQAGDYLYCPVHNEAVLVGTVTGSATWSVAITRFRAGTEESAHDSTTCVYWYGYGWRTITFDDPGGYDPPAQHVSSFASDGKYVYAAFTNLAGNNGSVWRGNLDGADWVRWAEDNNITHLASAGGYLYGAQDNYSSVSAAGYFAVTGTTPTETGDFTSLSLSGAMQEGYTSAGLTESGNYVYWAVTDGLSRSALYCVHNSDDDPFQLAALLPSGFIATCLYTHLGKIYIGGYFDNLDNMAGDTGLPRYEGGVFMYAGTDLTLVVRLRTSFDQPSAYDTRVKGLCSGGPYLYILTNEDTYVYDVQHGGWSHASNTSTGIVEQTLPEENWQDDTAYANFHWTSAALPTATDAVVSTWPTWDTDTDGFMDAGFVVADDSTGMDGFSTLAVGSLYRYQVNAKHWKRWTIAGEAPDTKATLTAVVGLLQSQAGTLAICDGVKEARVALKGVMSGGKAVNFRVGLGWMKDVNGDAWDYEYKWSGLLDVKKLTVSLVFTEVDAQVWLNGKKSLTVARGLLRNDSGKGVWWSVGWPAQNNRPEYSSQDDHPEHILFHSIDFTAKDAYTPDGQIGGSALVTTMSQIAHQQGVTVVPVPGTGYDYVSTGEIAPYGFLELSDSAFHMGSVEKYFTSMVVEHTPLQDGQSIYLYPIKDDVGGGFTVVDADSTEDDFVGNIGLQTTTALINDRGKKIRGRVKIKDNDPNRKYGERLRVFRITFKFFPVNSPHVHTYYLNCREGVQCRTGRVWWYDPEEAIRHLFAAADSGEVVRVESLFTSDILDDETGEVGRQKARIESVKLYQGPGDMQQYNKLTGTVQVKMRRVDS